jgi:hypothetical protein
MDTWEAARAAAHKKFDEEVRKEHRLHIIQGAIMAPAIFIAPFIIMWMMTKVL